MTLLCLSGARRFLPALIARSRLLQGVPGAKDRRPGVCGRQLTDKVDNHSFLSTEEGYRNARVHGAEQVRGDLAGGQTQDIFPVDLK